jgi:hypothetical protein
MLSSNFSLLSFFLRVLVKHFNLHHETFQFFSQNIKFGCYLGLKREIEVIWDYW